MSARNGNAQGRLIAVEGSGGRSMSVAPKCSEYEAPAQIFQFVTVDAGQSIFDQHRPEFVKA
ncbi:MAG TPA: hypothetical protein VNV86_02060 [Candidatus Acidoferrum sp.]|nr:hypothetical protein [Candidatus Acidoferrum sp.]